MIDLDEFKYMGDAQWWDNRIKDREVILREPEEELVKDVNFFKPGGKVLELACGDGRNAVYLAKKGYVVTAVDFSEEALSRLGEFMLASAVHMEIIKADLSVSSFYDRLGSYDVVIANHYRISPKLIDKVWQHISPGGMLWTNGFYELPKSNPAITEGDLIKDSDFYTIKQENAVLIHRQVYNLGDRVFIKHLWKKA